MKKDKLNQKLVDLKKMLKKTTQPAKSSSSAPTAEHHLGKVLHSGAAIEK
jgi:hypothetical protein